MPPNPPVKAPTPAIQGHGETVLLIEDDQAVRELMVAVFKRTNYRLLVAETVEDALGHWSAFQPAIRAIVSDCELGHARTGLSLLHEFGNAKPGLVRILASGSLTDDLIDELERTTTIKCLSKPYSCLKVLELLQAGLDAQAR
ncbi:MAG: response regulator [Limisphaerales bacterium]